jgi:hypothetical protein
MCAWLSGEERLAHLRFCDMMHVHRGIHVSANVGLCLCVRACTLSVFAFCACLHCMFVQECVCCVSCRLRFCCCVNVHAVYCACLRCVFVCVCVLFLCMSALCFLCMRAVFCACLRCVSVRVCVCCALCMPALCVFACTCACMQK